jgi:anti-sigma factor RsiW
MDHETLKDLVFALHDGELSPALRGEAEAHLAACAECRAKLEGWRRTSAAFFRPSSSLGSERFVRGVMERIEEEAERLPAPSALSGLLRIFSPLPRLALAGAAALAAALFLVRPAAPPPPALNAAAEVVYVAELMEGPAESAEASAGADERIGTAIEEYFL